MAAQLSNLQSLVGDAEFTAPLSPAISLDIITGQDEDGWPVYLTVSVKDRLVTPTGRMYRVLGFTTANTLICRQSGLDIDPAIKFVELEASAQLKHADAPVYEYQHKSGLVSFA